MDKLFWRDDRVPAANVRSALLFVATMLTVATGPVSAATRGDAGDPWHACTEAVATAERNENIPRHLMAAISLAESGRWNSDRQAKFSWPWTVMAEGEGRFLPTKAAAIATVRDLQARKVRNIDVGCMQINLRYHPDAFDSLDEAFDPAANVAYGSRYLKTLFDETRSWQQAAGRYHSATPEFNRPYRMRILKLWNEQRRLARQNPRADQPRRSVERRQFAAASAPPSTHRKLVSRAKSPRRGHTACPPNSNRRYACRAARTLSDYRARYVKGASLSLTPRATNYRYSPTWGRETRSPARQP